MSGEILQLGGTLRSDGPIQERNFGLSRTTNIDSTLSAVGRALRPVDKSDEQEYLSYEDHGSCMIF